MDPRFEKLSELFKNAEVAEKLLSCSAEEAAAVLQEQYQLEFTVDELNEVAVGIKAAVASDSSDELTSEQLDEVAGGHKGGAYYTGYYIGKTVIVVGIGVGIAAAAVSMGW